MAYLDISDGHGRQWQVPLDRPRLLIGREPSCEIHLAHPGESCRIVHVLDAVAPIVKIHGRSTVYPGFFGTTMPVCFPRFRARIFGMVPYRQFRHHQNNMTLENAREACKTLAPFKTLLL